MSAPEGVKIPLKVLIDKNKKDVLLAEVDSDFMDIVLSFLTLPLGKILGLFKKHYGDNAPVIGCLNTLYESLENLDDVHFWTDVGKKMLLNPTSTFSDDCRKLKYNLNDSEPVKYFTCDNPCCPYAVKQIVPYQIRERCDCGALLQREISILDYPYTVVPDGVFIRGNYNYTVGHDMQIGASVSGYIIQNFHNLGITSVDGTEQKTMYVGGNEIIDLLKGLLLSKTPLTDLYGKGKLISGLRTSRKDSCEPNSAAHIEPKATTSRKMVVQIVLQKSTDKLLFAQAENDFVDFLFSLFTIPLGGVAHLLKGNTCLGSVDNLYRSVASFDSKHLKTEGMKSKLLEPLLHCMYLSDSQILPISDQKTKLRMYSNINDGKKYLTVESVENMSRVTIKGDPKGNGCYVKIPGMFMVTDKLKVTPLSSFSIISLLNESKVGLKDIAEVQVEIGVEEALRILKVSLTSTNNVLTNALKPALKKRCMSKPTV